jgi:outer membrane protein TolC
MKRNNSLLFYIFICLIFSIKGNGQDSKLSYDDFISNILKNHPLTERAKNESKTGELNLRAARGSYDPLINGNFDQKQFSGSNYYSVLNAELKQPIFTSQYLKFGYDYGIGTYISPELYTPKQGLPYFGAEVGLLQGLIIDKRRAEVLKAKEYVNYYDAEKQIQLNSLLFESSQRYFEWLFTEKQIALNNFFMQTAKQRLNGIEALANIGEKAAVDTIEAAIFYQTRLLDLQNAIIDKQKSINYLSSFNWKDNSAAELNTTFIPMDSLDIYFTKAKAVVSENLNKVALANPVLLKYAAYQKVLDVDTRLKKEMVKPNLNVKYNFLSNSTDLVNPAFSNNNYKWGLNLSFPLLLRNPMNEYKLTKIVAKNNSLELANKTNELNFKVNAIKQNLGILSEQLQIAQRSATYSKQLVEAEKLKFNNGESSLFMLNTRENKWLESELKLAEYKLKFIVTVLNIIYLNGNLNYKL